MQRLNAYTDGSYNSTLKQASWAFVIVDNNKVIYQDKGIILNETWNLGFQVAGECFGIMKALEWAAENNVKLTIFYDFQNLRFWVADLFGKKPWKTNKEYTIEYRMKVFEFKEYLDSMVKVKAHSDNGWNNYVDSLAKID